MTTHTIQDKIHEALKKLKDESNAKDVEMIDLIASIYESLKEKQSQTANKIEDAKAGIDTSVHLHPWYYIGGAALCGLLAGLLLRK